MPRRVAPLALLLAVLSTVESLAAQAPSSPAPDSAPRRVAPVVVRAGPRAPAAIGGASAVVASPDSLVSAPAPLLEHALRALPFVLVRQNSRGEAELSVRGSESRQAAVVLDGLPLSLGWDHRADPSLVPLGGIGRITLVRGLPSLLYGPNILGGVVELGFLGDEAPPPVTLSAGVEAHGARALAATTAAVHGPLTARAGVGVRHRPALALARGVRELPGAGAGEGERLNSDLRHRDAFGALRWAAAGGAWAGVLASAYDAERGVPPELHVAEPRLWRYPGASRVLVSLGGGTGPRETAWGRASGHGALAVTRGLTSLASYGTPAYDEVTGRERGDERTVTARLGGEHALARGTLRAAATLADVRYEEELDGAAQRYRQRLWSGAAEGDWPLAGLTRVTAGAALDGAETPGSGDKPPLGALRAWGARVGLTTITPGAARLHLSLSRRARFPSLRELYSGSLQRFEPNPALRPERLLGMEAGATLLGERAQLQAALFHHRLSDAIVRAPAGDGRFRRENRDELRSSGVELLAGWRAGGLVLGGDALLQRVRVLDPAGSRRAEHQPAVRGSLDAGMPLLRGVRLATAARYVGRQHCVHPDLGREVALDGRWIADAGVERTWRLARPGSRATLRALRLALRVANLGDVATYDQCGLPQPGRTAGISLDLR